MSSSRPPRRALLGLTLAAASWGIGTAISKRAVTEVPPLTLLAIQLAVSVTFLAVVMHLRGQPLRGEAGSALLARLGVLNPGIAYALSLLGLALISVSLSVLLWALEPLMILVLAAVVLRERVGPLTVVLSLVAVAGMVLVIYDPGGGGSWLGVALTLAGVACCATYTVAARRWLPTAHSTAQVVLAQQGYALGFALAALGAVAVLGGRLWPTGLTPAGALAVIVSGLLYYGLAYWFYLSALREVPASLAAVSFFLIPVFGVAAGYLLGERLGLPQLIGAGVVLVAVSGISWRALGTGPGLPALASVRQSGR